jgi:hypothetical protein
MDSYNFWTSTYQWENLYGYDFLYAGPLFIHQYSHAWLDLRTIQDHFMHERHTDYFENSRRAVLIQRQYAELNPHEFEGYGENCWALSATEGPGRKTQRVRGEMRRFFGYVARSVPYGPDDGTLSPPSILSSLPFAPEIVLAATRHVCRQYPLVVDACGIRNGFNATLAGENSDYWLAPHFLGLDQGIVFLMIENHRSQLIWNLMRQCRYVQEGLRRAGFKGGWL